MGDDSAVRASRRTCLAASLPVAARSRSTRRSMRRSRRSAACGASCCRSRWSSAWSGSSSRCTSRGCAVSAAYGLFGGLMAFGLVGMLIRGRGASNKMSLSELTQYRRAWFSRQDDVRDEIDGAATTSSGNTARISIGTLTVWSGWPARCGCGNASRAATSSRWSGSVSARSRWRCRSTSPRSPNRLSIEPATGHALRKFLIEQEYIDDMPKTIWLRRFPGLSLVGDIGRGTRGGAGDDLPAGGFSQPGRCADHRGDFGSVAMGVGQVAAAPAARHAARRLR